MRYLLFVAALLTVSLGLWAPNSYGQITPEPVADDEAPQAIVITPELVEAHYAYRTAQLRWQQYRFVELPQQRKELDNGVKLLESQIRMLKRRVRDYRPFLQVGRYSPARTASENDRLTLQAAEQQLKLLKNERINMMRYSRQNAQLHELDVLRTAAFVRRAMATAPRVDNKTQK